jgi:sulfoxide reductase heme-binding subunit YedZ
MLGLYTFFYVSLHFTTYLWLDQFFNWFDILMDIGKRPFITVGFSAFILLIPLAVSSNRVMIRKLGRKWKPLHSLVYPISVLALLHYVWLVKADLLEPTIYLIILILLLAFRLVASLSLKKAAIVKPGRVYGSGVKSTNLTSTM